MRDTWHLCRGLRHGGTMSDILLPDVVGATTGGRRRRRSRRDGWWHKLIYPACQHRSKCKGRKQGVLRMEHSCGAGHLWQLLHRTRWPCGPVISPWRDTWCCFDGWRKRTGQVRVVARRGRHFERRHKWSVPPGFFWWRSGRLRGSPLSPLGLALGLILGGGLLAICPGPGKGCPDELLNDKG